MDLNKLEELARAATSGPWTGDRIDGSVKYLLVGDNGETVIRGDNGNSNSGPYGIVSDEDEAYLMAANPATILDLIALVRKQEAALREQDATVKESLNVACELSDAQIEQIWNSLDGPKIIFGHGQENWARELRVSLVRACIDAASPAIWYEGCDTALAHGVSEGTGGAAPTVDLSGLHVAHLSFGNYVKLDDVRALLAAAPVAGDEHAAALEHLTRSEEPMTGWTLSEAYQEGWQARAAQSDRQIATLHAVIGELERKLAQPDKSAIHAAIGQLIVGLTELPILWGLDEPGALLRFSDVSKMLFSASKAAAPAAPTGSVE